MAYYACKIESIGELKFDHNLLAALYNRREIQLLYQRNLLQCLKLMRYMHCVLHCFNEIHFVKNSSGCMCLWVSMLRQQFIIFIILIKKWRMRTSVLSFPIHPWLLHQWCRLTTVGGSPQKKKKACIHFWTAGPQNYIGLLHNWFPITIIIAYAQVFGHVHPHELVPKRDQCEWAY